MNTSSHRSLTALNTALVAMGCIGLLTAPLAAAEPASSSMWIDGERLSLDANGMPLLDLLASVGREARISFSVQGDASRILISDTFQGLPLRRALGRVLSAHSHLLVERDSELSGRRIDVILLGSAANGASQTLRIAVPTDMAAPPTAQSAEILLALAVSSASAAKRSVAAEAIAYRAGDPDGAADYAGPLLVQLLSDPEEEARARALDILKDTADELPFDALTQVAREDPSAERRIQALALVVERSEDGESRAPLAVALNDRDPSVRARARELMLDWHIDATDE